MSGHLRRVRIVLHGLADPAISFGTERVGDLLVGRNTPSGYRPQQVIRSVSKCVHCLPSLPP
jgi:hypothetical protein